MSTLLSIDHLDLVPIHGFFISTDSQGIIIDVGEHCTSVTGYLPVDLLGSSVNRWIQPEYILEMQELIQQGFKGKSSSMTCEFKMKYGQSRKLQIVCSGNIIHKRLMSISLFVRKETFSFPDRRRIPNMIVQHLPLPLILYEIASILEMEDPSFLVSISWASLNGEFHLHIETSRMPHRSNFQPQKRDTRPVQCVPAIVNEGIIYLEDISMNPECRVCHWLIQSDEYCACWSKVIKSPDGHDVGKFSVHSTKKFSDGVITILELYTSLAVLAISSHEHQMMWGWKFEHDDLTELFNLQKFYSILKTMLMKTNSVSLLYIDLDNFGFLNDSVGIVMGNQILIKIAQIIRNWCESTQIAGRLAGDEFGIILQESNLENAIKKANLLLEVLREPIKIGKDVVHLTVSIGVNTGQDADKLIRNATQGSMEAKSMGGDTVSYFSEDRDPSAMRILTLLHDIHLAMDLNQLEVYYQPRVHPFTHEIMASEALIRWNHPVLGIIPPNEFIGALERHGQMARVGEWIVKRVCQDLQHWSKLGIHLVPVSVNFSPHQLLRQNIVDFLIRTLSEYEITPRLLQIELTERLAIRREHLIVNVINKLKQLGIQVLIDDFGAGHTSLSYLKKLPIYAIKLEKELTDHIQDNKNDLAIMESIVDLAHKMNLRVVVEGVESIEQVQRLRDMNCDELQGYLFSIPVTADRFKILLTEHSISPAPNTLIKDRRNFFRIPLPNPLIGKVTITYRKKAIPIGWSDMLVTNIGAEGLTMLTILRLPLQTDMLIRLKLTILGEMEFLAKLVWMHEDQPALFRYGIQFESKEIAVHELTERLNLISKPIRPNTDLLDGHIYKSEISNFFNLKSRDL